MRQLFIFILFIHLISNPLIADSINIGTPLIHNYQKNAYNAGNQNWDILQAVNGKMYFANNGGLLEFDGIHWTLYPLPNGSVVRTLFQTQDEKIYVGGFNEFGYFDTDDIGQLKYHSLNSLISEADSDYGEVWMIHEHADGLIFQSFVQLMILNEEEIEIIKAPGQFHFSFMVDNNLYVNDLDEGLMRYAMGKIFQLDGTEKLKGKEIWGLLSYQNQLMIATTSDGVFLYNGNELKLWQNPAIEFLKKNQIYSLSRISNDALVFGTIQNGVLIYQPDGSFLNLNMSDGLQNNTILCVAQDHTGNLWLGTDYGIDYIEINSTISKISQNYGLSAGYAAYINDEDMYFGTNQGVFYKERKEQEFIEIDNEFKLLDKTEGQAWFLDELGGELICGHTYGTFRIEKHATTKISDIPGGWYYMQVPGFEDKMIGGCYTGLLLFEKKKGHWEFNQKYSNFDFSSRSMTFDKDGSIWMAHGYEGAFHIYFSANYDSITHYDYYPLNENNLDFGLYNLVKFKDEVLFLTNDGLYFFDKDKGVFERETYLNNLIGNEVVKSMKIDAKGNVWYFNLTDFQVLRLQEDDTYTKVNLPFKSISDHFIHSFEFVYPYDENNVFIALEDGFAHYCPQKSKDYSYSIQCYINYMISKPKDSIYYGFQEHAIATISYDNNNIELVYSANDFQNSENIEFSSFLDGYDENWSDWQTKYSREFTNLYEGNYIFKVKARNKYGSESNIQEFEFKVTPPLFRSILAYILYTILFVLITTFLILFIQRRFELARNRSIKEEKEKSRQREERLQREALEAEKEVIRMRNDQLRKSMKQKNKELANATFQMVHKNETLINLKEKLRSMVGTMTNEENKQITRKLIKIINKDIDSEKQWEIFETHFENVHDEFLKRLKDAYPDLTPREMKLCAYLRMNISSKEISVLMNISTRGVEIARYRLRKKLKLNRDTNLVDFIISF